MYAEDHWPGFVIAACSLVRVMISCLDTFLLLQTQFKIQDMLLTLQAENVAHEYFAEVTAAKQAESVADKE